MDAAGRPKPAIDPSSGGAGINFFDTANTYSDGTSEEILGRALKDFTRRDEVVIATKVYFSDGQGANAIGLSRKAIFTAIDASLQAARHRLCRSVSDSSLGLQHADRRDARSTARCREERQSTLPRRIVHVRLAIQQGLHRARQHGWTPFVSMQNHYNLLYREEEREMMPLCADEGIGVAALEPARPRPTDPRLECRNRADSNRSIRQQSLYMPRGSRSERRRTCGRIATARGVPKAHVALHG